MSIESVMTLVNKKYGQGTLVKGSEAVGLNIHKISTGSAALDIALNGGWALGRLCELIGEYSTGKTTIACASAANFLNKYPNGYVLYVDVEGTFDVKWFEAFGGDSKRLIICHPASGEESGDIAISVLQHARQQKDRLFIVVDSIAALVPLHEVEGDMDNAMPAQQARLVNKMLRKMTVELRKDLLADDPMFTVMFLNQTRMKIGISFGDPTVSAGGKGKDFFVSQQVQIHRKENIKHEVEKNGIKRNEVCGFVIAFKVLKNKCQGLQHETGTFSLYIKDFENKKARTFDNIEAVVQGGLLHDIIERKKNTFIYDGKKYTYQKSLEQKLWQDPALYKKLYNEVMEATELQILPAKKTKLKLKRKQNV